jgi:hypothetical protein
MVILMALVIGATMTSYGSRIQAVQTKSQTEAMLAAEAGYEQAIFWMSQQSDILGAIQAGGGNGSIAFATGSCSYTINFHGFIGARPVFRVTSTGICGRPSFTRVVEVDVVQQTSGWAMGSCRIPNGPSSTMGVNFVDGEIIDIPLHINKASDSPDVGDIFISGSPTFRQKVEMSEPRKIGSSDKSIYTSTTGGLTLLGNYSAVVPLFLSGIAFDQPNVRITDATAVQSKVNRFRDSTAAAYKFTPNLTGCPTTPPFDSPSYKCPATQLEFFVQGGVGKVRITNNCAVVLSAPAPYDYNIITGSNPTTFNQYKIYGYHYKSPNAAYQTTVPITNTYVTQTIGGYTSDPGGQIYVNGNVIIGGDVNPGGSADQVVNGKITVVATGNIWIADSIRVDGAHTADANNKPTDTNPNVLGLIAQGVIKVVDPGRTPASPASPIGGYTYQPIGNSGSSGRYLPDPTVVEAAMTIGGGGFGAEYVGSGRKEFSGSQDNLRVCGSITEVIRGVVGISGGSSPDGYIKNYYIDTRLMSGILPGDIWFGGKYIPAPAGWHDHSAN